MVCSSVCLYVTPLLQHLEHVQRNKETGRNAVGSFNAGRFAHQFIEDFEAQFIGILHFTDKPMSWEAVHNILCAMIVLYMFRIKFSILKSLCHI
jgi:hypothetical protein